MQANTAMPVTSICIPTYNNADTIERCINSIISQTFTELEIIVVDDCSTDETFDRVNTLSLVHGLDIRVYRNNQNLGLVQNHNRCIQLARGKFLKFVHADDTIMPECISEMVALANIHALPLVFARRIVRSDDSDWSQKYSRLDATLQPLSAVNPGHEVIRKWIQSINACVNPIGEPTAVLISAEAARRAGGFTNKCVQLLDVDLWMQVLTFGNAGFVDKELSVRYHTQGTASAANKRTGAAWLDRPYAMIRLGTAPSIPVSLRLKALRQCGRDLLGAIRHGHSRPSYLSELVSITAYSFRRLLMLATSLSGLRSERWGYRGE